jgi:hypothetical protein
MTEGSAADSIYDQRCRRAIEVMERDEQRGADSARLAEKVLKIVEMSSPRLVYREGLWVQKTLVNLLGWLPNGLVEKLLMDSYKI